MSNLNEVIIGLKNGQKYRRYMECGGEERLIPSKVPGQIEHVVASKIAGGSGGSAELDISILNNGRWPMDGWEPC